jgi:hypothetical protein
MTASTASIPVLHYAEVVPFTHKSCYPSATELYGPHTPLLRKRGRVKLRGLYKVPLALENPLQFLGSAMLESPVWKATTAKSTREPPYSNNSPTAPAPFG